jgi:hypothetical protein
MEKTNDLTRGIQITNLVILIIILLILFLILYLWRILIVEIRTHYDNYRFYHQVARQVELFIIYIFNSKILKFKGL